MTLAAGQRLGSYEVLSPLGAGGMGEVYRARDSKLGRDVAIKVLPAALAGSNERLARLQREAKLQGRCCRLIWGDCEIALREGENVLGRTQDAVAWIASSSVSRRHARILVDADDAMLEDLGSKNGTRLRGVKIDAPSRLASGDEIRLGSVRMTFHVFDADSTRSGSVE